MKNLQKNLNIIWQPPITRQPPPPLAYPPFLTKIFRPPPAPSISINFEKVEPPTLYEKVQTMLMSPFILQNLKKSHNFGPSLG